MNNNRIFFVVPSLLNGGMERVVANLSNYLINNHDISIILLTKSERFFDIDERVKIYIPPKIYFYKIISIRYIQLFFFIRNLLKRERPNIVFSFGESYNSFIIFCSTFLHIPVAVSNRANPLSSLKGFRGAVNPYFYEYAFVVIMQTQKGIDLLEEKYRKVKFIKIGNPFNIPDNPSLLKNRAKIIINVGSIGGNKNQHLLVRYFAEIEHKKDWIIYFVGDGPKREILKDEIEKHKLCESVFILGVRDDVSDLLNNAQIFAFTSSSEGFPNALGEAMAAGCSCISFDCLTGPSELIDNNLNGYLINSGDDEGYKEKLQLLMNDEQLRENFGIAARNKIKNNFSVNEIAKKYLMLSDSSKK